MRKIIITLFLSLMILTLVSCNSNTISEDNSPPAIENNNGNKGITVNTISFEEISDEKLSEDIKSFIEENKSNKGYSYFTNSENGEITLVVFQGEKSTGGYDVEVLRIEDNEGKTNVLVKEIEPSKDSLVTMAITYPYTVVKFSGTTDDFYVENTKGEVFEEIK